MITWDSVPNGQVYYVIWGITPDKLYSSWLVYGQNELDPKSFTAGQTYYFLVKAFNENGVSTRTKPMVVN